MALEKTTKTRLEKIIEYMKSLPASANKHFAMRAWIDHDGGGHRHEELVDGAVIERKHLTLCGTTACALGWAATMPYFRRAGLKVVYSCYGGEIYFKDKEVFADETARSGFLKLENWQAEKLFGGFNDDPTPKAWARRARKLLKEWEAASRSTT